MRTRTATVLLTAAFAAGVGVGLLVHRFVGLRSDRPAGHPSRGGEGATPPGVPSKSQLLGLYTDDEARKVSERWDSHDPNGEACLLVVPNGTAAPLMTVFGALGFDPARLGKPAESGFNLVVFLTWQVSPSYNLSCMTAINDPDNEGIGYTDPRRRLYGINIVKRDE